jgi:serine/threonine protein kinase
MEQIGKYQLQKVLGKGASATVWLALDSFSRSEVALKVLDQHLVSSPEFDTSIMPQFMNEAALAGKLSHPHIAGIYEASLDKGTGYIAVEYVPGGNLSQYATEGSLLSPEHALQVAFKACGALDYAFKQGIVHRDIKPANIMVVSGSNIKVGDFGAAYLKTAPTASHIGDIGSPYYMSPEQIQSEELGMHSDMFALGVVLYELFTGQRPFVADTMPELFKKIIADTPVPPSERRGGVSKEIDRILLQMLAKKPQDRYPSWAELALDIANIGRMSIYQQEIPDSVKFGALRKVPVLERLDEAEIWELVHAGRWSRLPPRKLIVREGENGTTLFFLGTGQVKVTKQSRLLGVLSAGECFGEMAFIKGGSIPRQASVESMTDVIYAEFDSGSVESASMNCQLQLNAALLHSLVDRLSVANERLV